MVTSSLSPERAETIAPQPRATAASNAAFASVTVPTWLTLISAALHTAASPARATRSALVTSTSSPTICTLSPIDPVPPTHLVPPYTEHAPVRGTVVHNRLT